MNKRCVCDKGLLRGLLKNTVFCVVMAGVGLGVLQATRAFLQSREPSVDFSQRALATRDSTDQPAKADDRLRFAVATMVSAEATFSTYQQLVRRICRDVGRPGAFVVRPSYTDVRRQLEAGKVDVALVCTGTYIYGLPSGRIKLLAQPEFVEGLQYRCLLLVPAQSRFKTMEDLRGMVMAFTDRESNTGCLVPTAMLASRDHDPASFFRKVIFTGSHDRSIRAVATKIVDCAAVDSLIWYSSINQDPSLTHKVRVIWQSESFGPPPIVVPVSLPEGLQARLQKAFLGLDKDEEGRHILSDIGIRRFVSPRPESYRSAIKMYQRLGQQGGSPWR